MTEAFAELMRDIDSQLLERASPEGFMELVPPIFETVLEEGLAIDAVNKILRGILDDNLPITARHTAGQFILLHTSQVSNWTLIYYRSPPKFLYLTPADSLQAAVGGHPLRVERFGCERPRDFAILQPDLELRSMGREAAAVGQVFRRRGCREILDWSSAVPQLGPGLTLRANSGPLAPFEWAFDRSTLRAVGLAPIDPIESSMTTIMTLLSAAGSRESLPFLEPFLSYEKHFVRWRALQTIAAIDVKLALDHLARFADDPHPEVSTAARASLERLSAVGGAE